MTRVHEFGVVDRYRWITAVGRRWWRSRHRLLGAAVAAVTALAPAGVAAVATAPSAVAGAVTYTAYVANCGRSVTPVDVATNIAGPNIPIGDCSDGIAITPDGATAYVTNYPFPNPQGTVTPIDLATGTPGAPIPVGPSPSAIAIDPAGTTAYVTTENGVVPITVASNQPQSTIPVPDAYQIAITPDGKKAYVTTILIIQYSSPYSYKATGLSQSGPGTPFIVQVEGATPLFSATFQVADNLGDVSNTVSYP